MKNNIKPGDRVKTPCGEGIVVELKKGNALVCLDDLYIAEFFKELVKPIEESNG